MKLGTCLVTSLILLKDPIPSLQSCYYGYNCKTQTSILMCRGFCPANADLCHKSYWSH